MTTNEKEYRIHALDTKKISSEKDIVLDLLLRVKKHVTTAPTHTPKDFNEQIVLYDDGSNYRLYVWINGTWRYVALT